MTLLQNFTDQHCSGFLVSSSCLMWLIFRVTLRKSLTHSILSCGARSLKEFLGNVSFRIICHQCTLQIWSAQPNWELLKGSVLDDSSKASIFNTMLQYQLQRRLTFKATDYWRQELDPVECSSACIQAMSSLAWLLHLLGCVHRLRERNSSGLKLANINCTAS